MNGDYFDQLIWKYCSRDIDETATSVALIINRHSEVDMSEFIHSVATMSICFWELKQAQKQHLENLGTFIRN